MTSKPAPTLVTDEKTINSVERALKILSLFSDHAPELGITEMARLTELHKSTLAGLVYTLERNDYLTQNPETRKYRLGLRIVERANVAIQQFGVARIAHPHMVALNKLHNEAINLGVLEGTEIVYLDHIRTTLTLGIHTRVGKRGYLHCTALGKAILSHLPLDEAEVIIDRIDFVSLTPQTIVIPALFRAELDMVRKRGYALDNEENKLGGRCVAAPIFGWGDRVVAAVSLSAPIARFPVERIEQYAVDVRHTAQVISNELGAEGAGRRL